MHFKTVLDFYERKHREVLPIPNKTKDKNTRKREGREARGKERRKQSRSSPDELRLWLVAEHVPRTWETVGSVSGTAHGHTK